MDPLRTPDHASDTARAAFEVGTAHREEALARDAEGSRAVSDRHFREAVWDPCYDVSVDTALRTADHAMVARTAAVYGKKAGEMSDYTAPPAPGGLSTNAYPSAKIQQRVSSHVPKTSS